MEDFKNTELGKLELKYRKLAEDLAENQKKMLSVAKHANRTDISLEGLNKNIEEMMKLHFEMAAEAQQLSEKMREEYEKLPEVKGDSNNG